MAWHYHITTHRRNPHPSPLGEGLMAMPGLGRFISHCHQHLRLPSPELFQVPTLVRRGGQSAGVYPCLCTSGFILPVRPAYISWRAVWDGQGNSAANWSFRIRAQASKTNSVSRNRPVKRDKAKKKKQRGFIQHGHIGRQIK